MGKRSNGRSRNNSHNGGNNSNNGNSNRNNNNNGNRIRNSNNSSNNKQKKDWNGKKNNKNWDNNNQNNNWNQHDESYQGLNSHERNKLTRTVKDRWKLGDVVKDIVSHCRENKLDDCPAKFRHSPDGESKLSTIVTQILQDEMLMNHRGQSLPINWPEDLQVAIVQMKREDTRLEDMWQQLKDLAGYKAVFTGNKPDHWGAISAIGHFLSMHEGDLDDIAAGKFIPPVDDDDDPLGNLERADDWSDESRRDLMEKVSQEAWAKAFLETAREQHFGANYVHKEWAFQEQPPKFGQPSRFVIRQGEVHDPSAPDPLPDPVRPVANAPFHPRKCQGTHGCSRHCTWNRDFKRRDGWSQHIFNNRFGISMYLQEAEDEIVFQDADGDVLMHQNYPPWMLDDKDQPWRGTRVDWTRCLAYDDSAGHA